MPTYNFNKETPCGWGIYLNGQPICSQNPAPEGSNPNDSHCPALDIQTCCYAWEEHAHCPKLRSLGLYSHKSRRK